MRLYQHNHIYIRITIQESMNEKDEREKSQISS